MTKIKFCGLKTLADIDAANKILPEYAGFVFAPKSKRYITPAHAKILRESLDKRILAVGVFVNEKIPAVAELLNAKIIDIAQLHGNEDEFYIKNLRELTDKPIIKAFQVKTAENILAAEKNLADFILLDAGAGDGKVFDWNLLKNVRRNYFLAGGLTPENISDAINSLKPFAVDVSSGIETDGKKNFAKMKIFADIVRRNNYDE